MASSYAAWYLAQFSNYALLHFLQEQYLVSTPIFIIIIIIITTTTTTTTIPLLMCQFCFQIFDAMELKTTYLSVPTVESGLFLFTVDITMKILLLVLSAQVRRLIYIVDIIN